MTKALAWINPNCSKCRSLKGLLEDNGVETQYRHYLDQPPTVEEIQHLLGLLASDDPRQIMRSKEKVYLELGLEQAEPSALIEAIANHPILLERPIFVLGDRAVVARPPEKALELLR